MKTFLMLNLMGMFITGAALADEKIYATDKYGRQLEQVLVAKGTSTPRTSMAANMSSGSSSKGTRFTRRTSTGAS